MNLKKRKRKAMKTKTKQIIRTGTESEKWRVFSGAGKGRNGGKRYREEEA